MSRSLLAASAMALALMVAILCWQVLARYLFEASPAWAEQSALLLMIWMTFLGTASGIADGFHIRIAEGVESLPCRWRQRAVQLANCLIVLCGLLMLVFGTILVMETWTNIVPTLPLTRGMVYSVIPASGLLIAAFALHHLARREATGGSRGSA
jgi:TRAP-type C4-dicarboxylate transport system permease small subunit